MADNRNMLNTNFNVPDSQNSSMQQTSSNNEQVQINPQQYRWSAEEVRALRECNRESFYFRCLPIAATTMVLVHLAVKQGYLKPHPRWGNTFKMMGAGLFGWITGKISYQRKCEEKLMHLPNSKIGEMLRKRRGYHVREFGGLISDDSFGSSGGTELSESISTEYSGSKLMDLDQYRDLSPKGLDDSQRPTLDTTFELPEEEEVKKVPQVTTTYEELRRKNREEYEARYRQQYQPQSSYGSGGGGGMGSRLYSGSSPASSQSSSRHEIPAQSTGRDKNQYGDVWDT